MKKISVMGLGYIGLPTAIVAAENGFDVVGFDIDAQRVARIRNGDAVIDEPETGERLNKVIQAQTLRVTTSMEHADCYIIAVPTPFKQEKKADLSYVYQATHMLATVLRKGDCVILESTIPVGTTDYCAQLLEEKTGLQAGNDFFVAHCPERVLPGQIFHELIYNSRIIGGINPSSMNQAKLFYKQFVKGSLYLTNATTAEMVKLVENSSRDVELAFANQVAAMAYEVGLDPFEVIELANKHPRVNILKPSCGVGGHCIAVDPWFLVETFPAQTELLKAAREVNDEKPHQVVACIRSWVEEWKKKYGKNPVVLTLGVTYKPDVDDLRESPALEITRALQEFDDAIVLVCEPNIEQQELKNFVGDSVVSYTEGIEQADIIVCLVHHTEFKSIDSTTLSSKKILDFCGLFYQSHRDTQQQEQLYWPANSLISMTPFEPRIRAKYAIKNMYKECCS